MSIQYSSYQNDLFAKIEERTGHVMVNAVAGSGKTFSLLECMRRSVGDSIFVAFNKSIATELATKVPSHVQSQTLHSFGYAVIRKSFGGYIKADNKKLSFIMQKYKPERAKEHETPVQLR